MVVLDVMLGLCEGAAAQGGCWSAAGWNVLCLPALKGHRHCKHTETSSRSGGGNSGGGGGGGNSGGGGGGGRRWARQLRRWADRL